MIYIPKHFAEADTGRLHALVRDNSFGMLLSQSAEGIQVTHLPMLLDASRNVIRGHMARANPHWKALEQDSGALAIFSGPHHYVSPSWYDLHPSVPTWNYAVVHVQGKVRLMHDAAMLASLVRELVEVNEAFQPAPWRMDLPPDYQAKMLTGIVGFELEIARLEGKFKLSQNRPGTDQARVIEALEGTGSDVARDTAALMKAVLGKP
jgi:transcriptional regulator